MSDKKQVKETTPPPLLLMPAGEGLTLNPPHCGSLLMPLVQSEPSLMAPGAYCILLCKKYCHVHGIIRYRTLKLKIKNMSFSLAVKSYVKSRSILIGTVLP